MPTTSNFGWTTPADTDLVKDGAAAIRTLGNGIDTSLVDLKGGTTGQYLIKQSNTDLDFTWTTNTADIDGVTATSPLTGGGTSGTITVGIQDATTAQKGAVQLTDSISSTSTTTAATPNSVKTAYDLANGAIAKSLVDAKADLITATADNTPARLAVGNNGETLVADSSTSTGLRYSAAPAMGNSIINSGMDFWQRGTSFTPGFSAYTADRWLYFSGTNLGRTVSRQPTNDTTNLPYIQYAMRLARDSGSTDTNAMYIAYSLESADSRIFAGKTINLSFFARRGANYSASANSLSVLLQTGTGTDQNVVSGFTGGVSIINTSVTLTTTWQRFTVQVNSALAATVGATATQIGFYIGYTATGTAGANDWFEITGVQIDTGSAPLPYRRYSATLAGELAACQRYYEASSLTGATNGPLWSGNSTNGVVYYYAVIYKAIKRTNATITIVNSNQSGFAAPTASSADGYFRLTATANATTNGAYFTADVWNASAEL